MHRIPRALAPFTYTVGLAYESIVRVRNALYGSGILPQRSLQSPVVSIGNVTMGGTGKTPLVIFMAKKIVELGFTPVILSRGYGRSDSGTSRIFPPKKEVRFPVRDMGDEPALIRRHIPEAWFGISRDRSSIGSTIEQNDERMVFILDDGFQHRKLHRDLDIVVIDPTQPIGSNRIFPRGTLREPLSGLVRSSAVVINGTMDSETVGGPVPSGIRPFTTHADLFHCEQYIKTLIPYGSWKNTETQLSYSMPAEPAFLVAALGNPLRFQSDILKLGIRISGTHFYKDHYKLQPGDWDTCIDTARETGAAAIIVSEKDAVKISEPPAFPLLVSVQETRFRNEEVLGEVLHDCIIKSMNG